MAEQMFEVPGSKLRALRDVAEAASHAHAALDDWLHLGKELHREEWYAIRDGLGAALAALDGEQPTSIRAMIDGES